MLHKKLEIKKLHGLYLTALVEITEWNLLWNFENTFKSTFMERAQNEVVITAMTCCKTSINST